MNKSSSGGFFSPGGSNEVTVTCPSLRPQGEDEFKTGSVPLKRQFSGARACAAGFRTETSLEE